ncbi:hypothetical protein EX975_22620 [Salmonella enterica subsp. enterica serovar Gaminara]|uniref:Uncharacterized protein n=2 Tax=Salmonella enterica I TaxID=59201 RepID=A0A602MVV0_SALET|nr:hypothetical protein [Salmonella enterica subsp. enterica serovar Oranienburg]EAA7138381.1 hypothetical protein [Salmonella enterica]EBQ6165665.1 hypothetical protein [Salmonella enterica subsp. enterica serovar Senftenberg]EBU8668020.1 hypothetical protein [Salmonella enterica subsp. enterica serovar Gaminara]EBV8483505.1 hypothetical protein [Salmonella enterica subsp. enterica serovar Ago]EBX0547238.1 hypothetical protein [Salmonella enterica subsp. houtenae serovar 44:z4,z23:-]EBY20346
MSASTKLWCCSVDDETFNSATFLTREEAIIYAVKEFEPEPGAVIHIARASHPDLSELFDVDDLTEGAASRAYEFGGEYADGFPELSVEEKKELERLILSYLKPIVPVNFYRVDESEAHTITFADLEMAAIQMDIELQQKKSANPHSV